MVNKKDYIYDTLRKEKINVCLLQEVELKKNYPIQLMSSKDYKIESELCTNIARSAIIISNCVNYKRRHDLEEEDMSLVIIDVDSQTNYRIINLYRQFNPPNNHSQVQHFTNQLNLITIASRNLNGRKLLLAGDFNLDETKRYSVNYRSKNLFEILNETVDALNLIQLIDSPTWQRIVQNQLRESTIDHLYVTDPTYVNDITLLTPLIGDHKLIVFTVTGSLEPPEITYKRNWQNYSQEKLNDQLSKINFEIEADEVQTIWNKFESLLMPIIDEIAPLVAFVNNVTVQSTLPNETIKRKLNLRKKLLKILKINKTDTIRNRIKNLNVEIKRHFLIKKTKSIRRKITPGNSKSLWDAVKIAKDVNNPKLPKSMFHNGIKIPEANLADSFAELFKSKVQDIVNEQVISNNVYNGKKKINANTLDFMTETNVLQAIKSLKPKYSEGYDRIPVKILYDGIPHLLKPLSYLFNNIYAKKQIPEQWLISKITPIFKKGNQNEINNYRPISNLCACSKIFEKLILMRLSQIESVNNIDLTGKSQHGFKAKHSTLTAGLQIQSLISSAVDDDMFALMASLDLSSAFDVVNVKLLLKRLEIIGLPHDLIELVSKWLTLRYFYVSLGENNSYVHESDVGTVQGSVLGPILYALFVSPLLDLEKITLFADDNYVLTWNKNMDVLLTEMRLKLEKITKWLRDSGLKVNESKTEMCLFHRKDYPPAFITLNNQVLASKPQMNVLGVTFDSKLNWQTHIANTLSKSKQALYAINLIRKFLTKSELLQVITSNYYSILYYNSEIWHIPTNTHRCKTQLLSASAAPLKLCT